MVRKDFLTWCELCDKNRAASEEVVIPVEELDPNNLEVTVVVLRL
jgi:hypothetical protein